MSTYVYLHSEKNLYTVGFFDPDGRWISESDHPDQEGAATRTAWLNGSPNAYTKAERNSRRLTILARLSRIQAEVDCLKGEA